MIRVRNGVWETNSSSTHTMQICSDEEYAGLRNGDCYIYDETIISRKDVISLLDEYRWKDEIEEFLKEEYEVEMPSSFAALPNEIFDAVAAEFVQAYTLETYFSHNEYLSSYNDTYTSKHGDVIHIFGLYGNDY